MTECQGILKIERIEKKKKVKFSHLFLFENAKGNAQEFPVHAAGRKYRVAELEAKAEIGKPFQHQARAELEGSQVVKCFVDGFEAAPPAPVVRQGRQQDGRRQVPVSQRAGNAMPQEPVWGKAPNNFVEYVPGRIARAPENEKRRWQGRIVCKLKALTPLLVSGPQPGRGEGEDGPAECHFMEVHGKHVIPGSSLKGMLRAIMEILSYSGMCPMNARKFYWRDITNSAYRNLFDKNVKNVIQGGFLRRDGADYSLEEAEISKDPCPGNDSDLVKTGKRPNAPGPSCYYFKKKKGAKPVRIDPKIAERLWNQLTEDQKSRPHVLEREKLLTDKKGSGLPVFYRDVDGKPVELGFCRYFRLEYEYSPFNLAWPGMDEKEVEAVDDIAHSIFGRVHNGARRGRVAVEACEMTGVEKKFGPVALANPKPEYAPFYLRQNINDIKVGRLKNGEKNKPESIIDYNDGHARLRGRKLYWHHDDDPGCFTTGNGNENMSRLLFPLGSGASGEFAVHVDRLTDFELGCLFEALELKPESAHKLGMGKALGFGSVKISVKSARICDVSEKYASLARRLEKLEPAEMEPARREELREKFRRHVAASVSSQSGVDFYELLAMKTLFRMLNWDERPKPKQVATMPLGCFGRDAILPDADEIAKRRPCR